ncbi:DinB family protein [Streptomyces sp. NPDC057689]|uniref:DinB family protein n=1 Tax=Streptomyces sp. NPDC057689 TaxID=3346213 RepID=UPI0036BF5E08
MEPLAKPGLFTGPGDGIEDPAALLPAYLDWFRDTLRRKCDGLPPEVLRAPVAPLGWSPLGLVQHLGWVERRWMRWGFAAEDVRPYPPGGERAEWHVPSELPVAEVWTRFEREVAAGRAQSAGVALHTPARTGGRFPKDEEPPVLGRILFHLFQEYARHIGHLDVARELIDGQTGE